jgi:uncharacterized protein YqjF (DUF2071 family)
VNISSPFLRAEWRHLAILNFKVEPLILDTLVPRGLELDLWEGRHYVSLIGFLFLNTRILGVPIPFHRNFEEVNLRFYARRPTTEGWRRGVVFIKELVPRFAIALAARTLYNEPYVALPMRHRIEWAEQDSGRIQSVTYAWTCAGRANRLTLATTGSPPSPTREDSEEAFFAERYWGYSVQRDGGVLEHHVERPRWSVAAASEARLDCDVAGVFEQRLSQFLRGKPSSAFLAAGSEVKLSKGFRLASGHTIVNA